MRLPPTPNTVAWEQAITQFASQGGTWVTLGPTDSGKTTWIAAAVAKSAGGRHIPIVSCDLGQATFGAPGLLSAGFWDQGAEQLLETEPNQMVFIGQTHPGGRFLQTVQGATLLTHWARHHSKGILVDTDGLVEGVAAREYKRSLLAHLKPCKVLFFGETPALEPLWGWCQEQEGIEAIKIPPDPSIQRKTPSERRQYRLSLFQRWFEKSETYRVSLAKDQIFSHVTGIGHPLTSQELDQIAETSEIPILHAERNTEGLAILTAGGAKSRAKRELEGRYPYLQIDTQDIAEWRYCLIGDVGADGFSSGMGYITGYDREPPSLTIKGRFYRRPGKSWLVGKKSFT